MKITGRLFTLIVLLLVISLATFLLKQGEAVAMGEKGKIKLPKASTKGKVSLEEAIASRRSERHFKNNDLTLNQIAQLLWAAQGITKSEGGLKLRAAPSAGALYPAEIYLLNKDGVFHYLTDSHELETVSGDDLRQDLSSAAWGQESITQAPQVFVIAAQPSRTTAKYGERGKRYVYIEAGHIAENLHLQAAALGLGSVPIGAFDDSEITQILSLTDGEEPLYIIPVGFKR